MMGRLKQSQGQFFLRESAIFRRVFERVVEACIAAGLVGREGFASAVQASVNAPERSRGIILRTLSPRRISSLWRTLIIVVFGNREAGGSYSEPSYFGHKVDDAAQR
jgi:hypothetical protein